MPSYALRQPWMGTAPALATPLDRTHPLAQGLLAFWPCDDGGGATLRNLVGANHGTITSPGWSGSPRGTVLSGDGTNTFVTTGNPGLNGTWGTFAFWVYAGFDTSTAVFKNVFDCTNGTRYLLYRNAGANNSWGLYLSNTSIADTSTSLQGLIATGLWTHIALVYNGNDATKQRVYKNGVLFATFTSSLSYASPANLYIGQQFNNQNRWQGQIERFGIWGRALGAAEVQQLYSDPLCLYAPARRLWLLPRRQGPTLAAATLTPTGAIVRTPAHHETGSSAAAGTIARSASHREAGSSSAAGAIARTPAHAWAGSSTAAGALVRTPARLLAATSTLAGALARLCAPVRAGRSTLTGALIRTPAHQEAGSSTPSGTVTRTPAHVQTGRTTPAGALARTPLLALAATVSAGAGTLARTITGARAAALAPSGALVRSIGTTAAGTLAATADLARTCSTPMATATLAATGALGRVAVVARGATLDLVGTLGRLHSLGLGATVTLAGRAACGVRRAACGTLAPGGALARTAALVRAGTVPLRGRFVGLTGVVRRAALALRARLALLLAPVRAGGQSAALVLPTRTHALAGADVPRPVALAAPARARTLTLSPHRTVPMQLVPSDDDPDAPLVIAPRERNIAFTADFSADIPSGRQIASVDTEVVRLDDPTATDISEDFVATTTRTNSNKSIEVIVGNGEQQVQAVYRVRLIATLDNSPATDLVGYFDLPCRE